MLSGLRLGNFKAFSETQQVPIRPLTLIFGPNSSGKSSLIHSLVLAHQGLTKGDLDVHRTEIGGDSVDLGGFKQYVFKRESERYVEWGIEFDTSKLEGRIKKIFELAQKITLSVSIGMALKKGFYKDFDESILQKMEEMGDLQYSDLLEAIQEGLEAEQIKDSQPWIDKYKYQNLTINEFLQMQKEPRITRYNIEADGVSILAMSVRKGGLLRLDTVNNEHPVIKSLIESIITSSTTTDQILSEDYDLLDKAISEFVPKISSETTKFLPYGIQGIKEGDFLHTISKGRRQQDLISAFNMLFPRLVNELIKGLAEIVEEQLKRFRYLGPLRSYPPRHPAFAQYHDPNWQAGGGFAWDEVRKNLDLRNKINEWLGDAKKLSTTYEMVVRHLLTLDDLEKHYSKRVDSIEDAYVNDQLGYQDDDGTFISGDLFGEIGDIPKGLKKIEQYIAEIGELVLQDKRTGAVVSHRDVGIGISQVLPVLVSAYANKEALIAIEQPEIHLHPALQAELGDVFVESALGENKNTFIIETHSEHLILRIMRRMRKTAEGELKDGQPVTPDDVCILYVDQPKEKNYSVVYEMRLDKDGTLLDPWPGGFFEEGFKERFL